VRGWPIDSPVHLYHSDRKFFVILDGVLGDENVRSSYHGKHGGTRGRYAFSVVGSRFLRITVP